LEYPFRIVAVDEKAVMVVALAPRLYCPQMQG
jgi:hypothetical protein